MSIINKNDYQDMKMKHGNSVKWKNFHRCTRNPFLKEYLVNQYNYKCQWCGKNIYKDRFCIHHIDYDFECSMEETTRFPNPTEKRPGRTTEVPDCARCSCLYPEHFRECVARLRPIHTICNKLIDEQVKKESDIYGRVPL